MALNLDHVYGNMEHTGKPAKGEDKGAITIKLTVWHPCIKGYVKDYKTNEVFANTQGVRIDVAEALVDTMRDASSDECGCRAAEVYRRLDTVAKENREHRASGNASTQSSGTRTAPHERYLAPRGTEPTPPKPRARRSHSTRLSPRS